MFHSTVCLILPYGQSEWMDNQKTNKDLTGKSCNYLKIPFLQQ